MFAAILQADMRTLPSERKRGLPKKEEHVANRRQCTLDSCKKSTLLTYSSTLSSYFRLLLVRFAWC